MTDILTGLMTGLPSLLLHFIVTVALLLVGILLHMLLTPMKEKELIAAGNSAAALSLAAATLGMALPLAATLATSQVIADIVIWGGVGTLVQVLIFVVARFIAPNLPCRIERGDMAAAITLAGWQMSIGLLNAAALAG